MRLGIVGCGALGFEVVKAIKRGYLNFELVALYDTKIEFAESLARFYGDLRVVTKDFDDFLSRDPDIVVEVASPRAVRQYALEVLNRGKIFVVMSSGGLLNDEFLGKVREALKFGGKIIVPSGAVGGVDLVKAISSLGDAEVVLRTIKSASSFKDEYLSKLGIRKSDIRERTLLFSGSASEAVDIFPTMINVAATLSLALGRVIKVEVYADPQAEHTIHEIKIKSRAVNATIKLQNMHHPDNPRTSYLAALSLIETLRRLGSGFLIGT